MSAPCKHCDDGRVNTRDWEGDIESRNPRSLGSDAQGPTYEADCRACGGTGEVEGDEPDDVDPRVHCGCCGHETYTAADGRLTSHGNVFEGECPASRRTLEESQSIEWPSNSPTIDDEQTAVTVVPGAYACGSDCGLPSCLRDERPAMSVEVAFKTLESLARISETIAACQAKREAHSNPHIDNCAAKKLEALLSECEVPK